MIELCANITEKHWSRHCPPPADCLQYFDSEEAWRAASAPYLCQIVTLRHSEWPDALWHVRLPEKIASDDTATTGAYQERIQWSRTGDGWEFRDLPLAELEGTIDGSIRVVEDIVEYSLALTNASEKVWPRALAWLCFNHIMATTYYRYRNFIFRRHEAIETPERVEQHYCVGGQQRDWWIQGEIEPDASLIATQCVDAEGAPFTAGIAAERAILLGQNPAWPCTDIGLFFGDVGLGQRSAVRGRIYFCRGTPEDLWHRYRQDFPR